MRVVLDTNTLVSALLSPVGPPRRIVNLVRAGAVQLYSSPMLLAELADVVGRAKFVRYWTRAGVTPLALVSDFRRLTTIVVPEHVPPVIAADPDDDHVLACALAGKVDLIVSGDGHLLDLVSYQGIPTLPAAAAERVLHAAQTPERPPDE